MLSVEVAATEAARRYGLMNRRSLAARRRHGLRVRPAGLRSGFWMKDTLDPPVDRFWGADRRILAVLEMVPCRSDPCPVYQPPGAVRRAPRRRTGVGSRHMRSGSATGSLLIRTP